jgi:RNA polymerase sigma-70 factor (ECF subfamily)
VGPWLPEPVATDPRADGAETAQLDDEVSMAMLIVLESLSPLERAAFVLTEVFGMSAPEVGEALDRSPAAVRQLVHRARSHVEARRPREVVGSTRHRAVTERFMAVASGGDMTAPIEVLAPDVVLVADGGGIRQAALRPTRRAEKVLRWLAGPLGKPESPQIEFELRPVNGELAIVASNEEGIDGVISVTVEDDRITALHGIRNREKLGAVGRRRGPVSQVENPNRLSTHRARCVERQDGFITWETAGPMIGPRHGSEDAGRVASSDPRRGAQRTAAAAATTSTRP